MRKNSAKDYLGYIGVRAAGVVIRVLPIALVLFFGRRVGDLWYFLGYKHRSQVYVNLRAALGGDSTPRQAKNISRQFFRNLVSNIMEALSISKVDRKYLDKYIQIEGEQYLKDALEQKKGVILLGVHAGSWELANLVPAILGYPYNIFVRTQKSSKLDELLNSYRVSKGCKLIRRASAGMRDVIRVLKNNEVLGMVGDQGGKAGVLTDFFGRDASMSTLGVRLAMKMGSQILPVFCVRLKGPYQKVIIKPPFELTQTGDFEKDLKESLERLSKIFQEHIARYPQEYLWIYKVWKYSKERTLLMLSDGKTGHLRQSEALAGMISDCLMERGTKLVSRIVEVRFKNNYSRPALDLSLRFSGRYTCQGCLWCLRSFLEKETFKELLKARADYIVSCGSSLSAVNCVLSRENLAQSIVIMRPSLGVSKFDIALIPRHDRPVSRKNVIVTEGALNLIDDEYLKAQALVLKRQVKLEKELVLGILLGGDAKGFKLTADFVGPLVEQVKSFLEKSDAQVLISTSRRTDPAVEDLVRKEFSGYPRCKLMVIANEKNIPEAVGGILALSKIMLVSAESISMVCEAVACGKHAIVFGDYKELGRRHRAFLENFAGKGYIHLSNAAGISQVLNKLASSGAPALTLNDREKVKEELRKRLR